MKHSAPTELRKLLSHNELSKDDLYNFVRRVRLGITTLPQVQNKFKELSPAQKEIVAVAATLLMS